MKVPGGDALAPATERVHELLVGNRAAAAAWRALAALGIRCVVLYERPLDGPRTRKPVDPGIELGRLRIDEADAYAALRPDGSAAQVRERFSAGDVCCVARSNGDLVAVRWFSTRRAAIPFLEHSFALDAGEGYLYNAFTAPEWRGRGVAGALTAFMLDELEREGVDRALSAARPQRHKHLHGDDDAEDNPPQPHPTRKPYSGDARSQASHVASTARVGSSPASRQGARRCG